MREYEKIASRVGMLVAVAAPVVQIIASEISGSDNIAFGCKLLIAIGIGAISFSIMEWMPRLILKEKSLCGLYIITYADTEESLCSILNIDHNPSSRRYSIDMFDCCLQGGSWVSVENQYPINLDNIVYDLSPRGMHLVSNDDNCDTCVFVRFTYKNNLGTVKRYGSRKPFDKPCIGQFQRLSRGQLCEVFNSQYNDRHFCDLPLSMLEKCKYEQRAKCCQGERVILDKVRRKGCYLRIAKVLYEGSVVQMYKAEMQERQQTELENGDLRGNKCNKE